LAREILFPSPALERLLAAVFDECRTAKNPVRHAERKRDFVFHMTDWLNDLRDLEELYGKPEKADPESASTFVAGFLYHVIPHLKAAGRLLLDEIPDPFSGTEGKS
jgi:hypothetical protein